MKTTKDLFCESNEYEKEDEAEIERQFNRRSPLELLTEMDEFVFNAIKQ